VKTRIKNIYNEALKVTVNLTCKLNPVSTMNGLRIIEMVKNKKATFTGSFSKIKKKSFFL